MSAALALAPLPESNGPKKPEVLLTAKHAAELSGLSVRSMQLKAKQLGAKPVMNNGVKEWRIPLAALPSHAQAQYFASAKKAVAVSQADSEDDAQVWADAPAWARQKAQKYVGALEESAGLSGAELKAWIGEWNAKHPAWRTSYPRILAMRKKVALEGKRALLPAYGKSVGKSTVSDAIYAYFKALYLKEGGPSLRTCWTAALGEAHKTDVNVSKADFPSWHAFHRRLMHEMGESLIYLARAGEFRWNKKYGPYIPRDNSGLECGEVWVADHAQIDVMVMHEGRPIAPWVSAWVDQKSCKWLGWYLHAESPNSDQVFQAFYYAAKDYGIPAEMILDNGKDFKCRDFSGNFRFQKVEYNTEHARSLVGGIGTRIRFARVRNAQAKIIERTFNTTKEFLSKHMVGYRGGNHTERPEKLKAETKSGVLMTLPEFTAIFDDYVVNVLNKAPSEGKDLKGMSRDDFWNQNVKVLRRLTTDALKMFCMRTSKPLRIVRNGIKDAANGVTYYHPKLPAMQGRYAYLRRDPKDFAEAWAFDAEDESFIAHCVAGEVAATLARTPIEQGVFKSLIARQKRERILSRELVKIKSAPSGSEIIRNMAVGMKIRTEETRVLPAAPKSTVVMTAMDLAVAEDKRQQQEGRDDLTPFLPPLKEGEEIALWESDLRKKKKAQQ